MAISFKVISGPGMAHSGWMPATFRDPKARKANRDRRAFKAFGAVQVRLALLVSRDCRASKAQRETLATLVLLAKPDLKENRVCKVLQDPKATLVM